jgi:hypothetical protein
MSVKSIQKIVQFDNNRGKNYRELLDLLKQGICPISPESYNTDRHKIVRKLLSYLPAASDIHGSYAPQGVSFADANKQYGRRYDGYHVSEDPITREKILFPLAQKLPDAKGNEVDVLNEKDGIILVRLGSAGGKPSIEYEHDSKKNETRVHPNTDEVICVPFITSDGWNELKNGNFEKSDASNPSANYVWRANSMNWNGVFSLDNYYFGNHGGDLVANHAPSSRLGVLGIIEDGLAKLLEAAEREVGKPGPALQMLFDAIRGQA